MSNFLNYLIENPQLVTWIWTAIVVPFAAYGWKQINDFAVAKKIDKYTALLKEGIENAVKDVQSTFVDAIKGTDEWTDEKKAEALELAKSKAIYSLSDSAYKALKLANEDFDEYLKTLIEAKLADLKK